MASSFFTASHTRGNLEEGLRGVLFDGRKGLCIDRPLAGAGSPVPYSIQFVPAQVEATELGSTVQERSTEGRAQTTWSGTQTLTDSTPWRFLTN